MTATTIDHSACGASAIVPDEKVNTISAGFEATGIEA